MHLRAKFAIQIPVQLGTESAAVPKALGWTGITLTSPQRRHKTIWWGMKEDKILAFGCSCHGGTPATLSTTGTAPDCPASSDFVVELYVGIDSCLAAECWLYAISVKSCKGWEISALERGLEAQRWQVLLSRLASKPITQEEERAYAITPLTFSSCVIVSPCQKKKSGLLLETSGSWIQHEAA